MSKDLTVGNLLPNPKNPRRITDRQLTALKGSIEEFGDLSGIVYNRATGQLVGGHQRVKVLPKDAPVKIVKRFAEPTPLGTVAEGYVVFGAERIKYREVAWDESRERAANIAANRHGGDWDFPQLTEWMTDLADHGFELGLTGFESLEALGLEEKAQVAADRILAPPEKLPPKSSDGTDVSFRAKGKSLAERKFSLTPEQDDEVKRALELAIEMGPFLGSENDSVDANALSRVCQIFLTQNQSEAHKDSR